MTRKFYDTKTKARDAAVSELGPNATIGFDFVVDKVDGRWMWRMPLDEERKDPATNDQFLKATGKTRRVRKPKTIVIEAVAELVEPNPFDTPETAKAIEECFQANVDAGHAKYPVPAVVDKLAIELTGTTAEKLALEVSERPKTVELSAAHKMMLQDGAPAAILRQDTEETKMKRAKVVANNKNPKLKNPPDAKQAKAKAEKAKGGSMAFVYNSAILDGKTNAQALAAVKSAFPACTYTESDMQWARRKLEKQGKLQVMVKKLARGK